MSEPSCDRRSQLALLASVALLTASAGCVAYRPDPLDPGAVLAAIDADRSATPPATPSGDGATPDLATIAAWLVEDGPAITDARARFLTSRAVAAVDTPWPDPSLQLGPQLGWGDDVIGNEWTPFAQLTLSIPLSGRLSRQDELNRLRAERDRIDVLLTLRDELLALRGDVVTLTAAAARAALQRDLAAATRRAGELTERAVAAGTATALDTGLLELDAARAESAALDAELTAVRSRHAVAQRTGRAAPQVPGRGLAALPAAPAELPSVERLRATMLAHRSDFVRLRFAHEESERALRLQIALQYPDLQLQPRFSDEPGEDRNIAGLGIGIDLPLFDRNRVGIARATGERSAARTRFEAECRRALAELDRAHAELEVLIARRRQLIDEVAPRAARNVDLARRAVEAGRGDALRLLDVERTWRAVQVQILDARAAELGAWLRLEAVIGHPLLNFPGDPIAVPLPPAGDGDASADDPATEALTPAPWHPSTER